MDDLGDVTCDGCGFDGVRWDDAAAVKTIRSIGSLWREWLADVPVDLANVRPDDRTWSILEYADHMRSAAWNMRFVVDLAVDQPGFVIEDDSEDAVGPHRRFDEVTPLLDGVEAEGAALFTALQELDGAAWDARIVIDGTPVGAWWAVRSALHECFHHLRDVARIRTALGDGVRAQSGRVASLHVGGGGVPKPAVESAEVTIDGVAGDVQNDRLNHGRPFQAVCLWGTDVIGGLVAEGHPIFPGAAGENLTLDGIEWAALRPGAMVHVGDDLVLELSAPAVPCSKNAGWFSDGRFDRILHTKNPGWSRLYASVVTPGTVRAGDPVAVEPAS